MNQDAAAAIALCPAAHARLLARANRLAEDQVRAPSRLPGWSVGHVLAHLARSPGHEGRSRTGRLWLDRVIGQDPPRRGQRQRPGRLHGDLGEARQRRKSAGNPASCAPARERTGWAACGCPATLPRPASADDVLPAAARHQPPLGTEAFGILTAVEERELYLPAEQPLIGWRLFRVRRSESGFVLSAPLIHNPDFERFPSRTIDAICYEAEHPAPAPGCRCGLYAAIDGTLDSLSGYLRDSAHDHDPPIYAEVACTGRVFIDLRGVRAQRIEILRLATSASLWPDPGLQAHAVAELRQRYRAEVCGLDVVPQWVVANVMPQGAPPEDAVIDLDALLGSLARRSTRSR